jgi:hypothetical protein
MSSLSQNTTQTIGIVNTDAAKNKPLLTHFASTINDPQNGYYTLKQESQQLINNQNKWYSPDAMNEDPEIKQLKMKRQSDIRGMIESEQNIIIFTGIGLTFLVIVSVLVYKS